MNFSDFAEGPLLWATFIILLAAIASRLFFFILKIATGREAAKKPLLYCLSAFGRVLLPLHMVFRKRPGYAALRYLFHLCLFVVPVWLGAHIMLWSESRFEWDWAAIPDAWADWMTILVVGIALFFLLRRTAFPGQRGQSSPRDYLVIIFTALPFVSGYFLTHGTLDSIGFFSDNMRVIHVLSGEAMILMAAFLFCRTRLNPEICTGCASCAISCPTGTLEASDSKEWRIFTYSHYQCICCGSCMDVCPEQAAQLRHEVSLVRFFQVMPKLEIRRAELKPCGRCGSLFVPEPLFSKITKSFHDEYLQLCPTCRKTNIADVYLSLSPRHKSARRNERITGSQLPSPLTPKRAA